MLDELVEASAAKSATESKRFPKGKFDVFKVGGKTFGRAVYEPGWRWSEHVGPGLGLERCGLSHFGYVVSGTCAVGFDDGSIAELREGSFFYIPAIPHDSWVIGEQQYVSLHLDHAEDYASA